MTNLKESTYVLLSNLVFGYSEWLKKLPKDAEPEDDCPDNYFVTKEAEDIVRQLQLSTLTIPDLVNACVERSEAPNGFKMPFSTPVSYWGMAMMGEGGELCNLLAKIERSKLGAVDGGHSIKVADITLDKLAEEMGGIVIYLAILSGKLGISLEGAIIKTFNEKSDEIGYPGKIGVRVLSNDGVNWKQITDPESLSNIGVRVLSNGGVNWKQITDPESLSNTVTLCEHHWIGGEDTPVSCTKCGKTHF